MNHGNHIKYNDVIRFRNGESALMKVKTMDTLCGYVTYHGPHLYGEEISIPENGQCKVATAEDMATWNKFIGTRQQYSAEVAA